MQSNATSPDEYMRHLPEERKQPMQKLRETILSHIDPVIQETMSYGMIGYVIPHTVYPMGYHCNPELPLPLLSLANQKNYISVYDMALYNSDLEQWFVEKYHQQMGKKPDMGKCCIRFKNRNSIPYELIGELAGKVSAQQWIQQYEQTLKNTSKSQKNK